VPFIPLSAFQSWRETLMKAPVGCSSYVSYHGTVQFTIHAVVYMKKRPVSRASSSERDPITGTNERASA